MKNYKIYKTSILEKSDRWLITSFLDENDVTQLIPKTKMISLGDLLKERKESMDPQENMDTYFHYLGLENIQPFTGFLVDYHDKQGGEIKSRCKIFYNNDFLYGRLRPLLNKSIVINGITQGICSTEFLVFEINESKIHPLLLKYLVSSDIVQEQIEKYIAGASLPRIQAEDFLSIQIPLLDKTLQSGLVDYLSIINAQYQSYYNRLNTFKTDFNSMILDSIKEQKVKKMDHLTYNDLSLS